MKTLKTPAIGKSSKSATVRIAGEKRDNPLSKDRAGITRRNLRQDMSFKTNKTLTRATKASKLSNAIRSGAVDALVVSDVRDEQSFALEEAEHPYRILVETMNEGAVILAPDGSILYCNACFAGMIKQPIEKVVGTAFGHWVAPPDRLLWEALLQPSLQRCCISELALQTADGNLLPARVSIAPMRIEGMPDSVSVIVTNLTAIKGSQENAAAEKLACSILEQAAEAIVVCDNHERIIRASRAAHRLCGGNPLFQSFGSVFPLRPAPQQKENPVGDAPIFSISPAFGGKTIHGIETVFNRKDGRVFHLLLNAGPLFGREIIFGCVVTLTDLTEQKAAEAQRNRLLAREQAAWVEAETGRKELRRLAAQLVKSHEIERRRIARELHDEVGQALTFLGITLDQCASLPGESVRDKLREAQKWVHELAALARNLALELRPSMLDDLGLLPALLWHFDRYTAQTQVRVRLSHRGVKQRRFTHDIETAAYRIAQEALTNVARHAAVSEVMVNIQADDRELQLQIKDHGRGFDSNIVRTLDGAIGLHGMRERVLSLGGQFKINTAPGGGARIAARFPLEQPAC
ncbi:MAG: PAS domain S-box protein [Verrucomicrobia bacterium]|nr:PAS domain S-box protein [Verrucomicrobiota bacterium]